MTELQGPAPAESRMIEVPASVAADIERHRKERLAREEKARVEMGARATGIAHEINNSRPEGVPPTLPTDRMPSHTELTASTVRSGTGVRIDGAPFPTRAFEDEGETPGEGEEYEG